jgi:hypothetical protein
MKKSVMTGEQIFIQIKRAAEELNDFGKAVDLVGDEMENSPSHKLLSDKYQEMKRGLQKLKNKEYSIEPEGSFIDFGKGQ